MENIALQSLPLSQQFFANGNHDRSHQASSFPQNELPPSSDQIDRITISDEARKAGSTDQQENPTTTAKEKSLSQADAKEENLTAEELQELQKLQKRDAEVKAHEQAHKAVAGQHAAGGPSYTYEVGPNGKRYAVGGEVPIDMSKEATPEQTIQKMQIVARAALAPANPSAADRRIAARASMIANQARGEIQSEQTTQATADKNTQGADKISSDDASTDSSNSSEQQPTMPQTTRNSIHAILAYTTNTV